MAKRGQNEGTIFEERPGRWVASISLGYELRDGKRQRIRKKFVAETRRDVQQRLTAALKEQQTGGVVPIQRDTLGLHLEKWLKGLAARGRRDRTIESYTWLAQKHITPEIGQIPLTRLTQRDLNEYMRRKIESGLSSRTVSYCHAVIRSALAKAEKDGLVSRNVAKLAEPPGRSGNNSSPSIEPLTLEQAKVFLSAAVGHRLEALFSVALAVGLRRGEALGLEWDGLDLERGTLTVTQTVQRIKGKGIVIARNGKTDKSLRMIPLPSFAVPILRNHRERQAIEREFAGEEWREHGLVFTSRVGTPIEPRNLVREFHTLLAVVNIPRHRYHDLRHTAASLLLAQGATLHDVKEILGHSQISLTANLYGHAYTSVLRGTMDKVGPLLENQNRVAPSVAPQAITGKVN